jgi:hypothetical protein
MNRLGQRAMLRLAEQQVNVFRHHHLSVDAHVEATTHGFEATWEQVVNYGVDEIGLAAITTEGDEMRLSGFVKPAQTTWRENHLHPDHYRVQ